MADEIETRRVSEEELQRIFNEADYWGKVLRGEFYAFIKRCGSATNGPKDAVRIPKQVFLDGALYRMHKQSA